MTQKPIETTSATPWNTKLEIQAQPNIWRNWADELNLQAIKIKAWIAQRNPAEIWLCGAGTSAFIGETLAIYLNQDNGIKYRSISTTDFVSAPYNYPKPNHHILIVSFGRSGDSSETVAMLDILDNHYSAADRLNITCNSASKLATCQASAHGQQKTLVLPPETLDKGFAMTSSYTTMLLTALACLDKNQTLSPKQALFGLAECAENIFLSLSKLNENGFTAAPKRCIFLGSSALKGSAQESALKVLELTAGKTVTQWDSSLGFRHGPKAIVDEETKIYIFVSNHSHTRKYDMDMAAEIAEQYGADKVYTIGANSANLDLDIMPNNSHPDLFNNDAWCSILYVITAQLLSVKWSEFFKLNVDNPFIDKMNLTRVVTGVTVYPY